MKNLALKLSSLLLVTAFLLSCIGCGNTTKQNETNETAKTTEGAQEEVVDDHSEKLEISIATWGIGDAIIEGEDPIRDLLYEKFNITIKPYPVTWGDYMEKIQVWSASQQLPDITAVDIEHTDTFNKWVSQGVIRELPQDLSKFPNIKRIIDDPHADSFKSKDGKTYCIPKPNLRDENFGVLLDAILLRKDWMKEVGVEKVPENIDELIELLVKFQNEDPDGNGKNDTIGLTMLNFSYLTSAMQGIDPGSILHYRWVYDQDGKAVPSFATDRFYQGLQNVRKLFDAGVVDPDFAILKGEEGRDKFKAGKAGAFAHNADCSSLNNIATQWRATYPDKEFSDLVALTIPFEYQGKYEFTPPEMYFSALYFKNGMDGVKMNRSLELIDYLLSEEGYETVSFGFEGEDYTVKDGEIVMLEQLNEDGTTLSMIQKYPAARLASFASWTTFRADESPIYPVQVRNMVKERLRWIDEKNAKPLDVPAVKGLDYPSKELDNAMQIDTMLEDLNALMVAPDLKAAYDKMVKDYMSNGYATLIEEVNAALAAK